MTYQEVRENARKKLAPACRVCRECNGVACRGEIPGAGGKGTGRSFIRNCSCLADIRIAMNTLYENKGQDPSVELFGRTFRYPIFAAPIGAINTNYPDALNDETYSRALINGTIAAGCAAFTGDGVKDCYFTDPLIPLKEAGGIGVPTIKPWELDNVLQRVRWAEEAGAMALAMDIDAAGLIILINAGKPVYPKGLAEMKAIIGSTKLPFVIKGVMTLEGARLALDAGAYGIVVSNHGGRVLEDAAAPYEILPQIRQLVGDRMKIFVDGGIRTGADVFKAIALGADAVLVGRPYVTAAYGGEAEGVRLYTEKLGSELRDAMLMSGCATLRDITPAKIYR